MDVVVVELGGDDGGDDSFAYRTNMIVGCIYGTSQKGDVNVWS